MELKLARTQLDAKPKTISLEKIEAAELFGGFNSDAATHAVAIKIEVRQVKSRPTGSLTGANRRAGD